MNIGRAFYESLSQPDRTPAHKHPLAEEGFRFFEVGHLNDSYEHTIKWHRALTELAGIGVFLLGSQPVGQTGRKHFRFATKKGAGAVGPSVICDILDGAGFAKPIDSDPDFYYRYVIEVTHPY